MVEVVRRLVQAKEQDPQSPQTWLRARQQGQVLTPPFRLLVRFPLLWALRSPVILASGTLNNYVAYLWETT
jgi:hypothetical protein